MVDQTSIKYLKFLYQDSQASVSLTSKDRSFKSYLHKYLV